MGSDCIFVMFLSGASSFFMLFVDSVEKIVMDVLQAWAIIKPASTAFDDGEWV